MTLGSRFLSSVLALALAAFGFGTSSAQADEPGMLNVAPAAADSILVGAAQAADSYWARMGLAPTCPADLYLYDDVSPDVEGRADQGGCGLYITRRARAAADMGQTPKIHRYFLAGLCGTVTHERGHNLGLTHESGWPIMVHNRDGPGSAPTECWNWAVRVAPNRPKAHVSHRDSRPANWSRTMRGVSR